MLLYGAAPTAAHRCRTARAGVETTTTQNCFERKQLRESCLTCVGMPPRHWHLTTSWPIEVSYKKHDICYFDCEILQNSTYVAAPKLNARMRQNVNCDNEMRSALEVEESGRAQTARRPIAIRTHVHKSPRGKTKHWNGSSSTLRERRGTALTHKGAESTLQSKCG